MIDILKRIQKTQQEAKKIISDALIEADKIKQGMIQKSIEVNKESYLAEIAQAEKRANVLLKSNNIGIKLEIKKIFSTAERQAKEIEIKAKVNHEKAVNDVLNLIFYRSEKK
jgi:vacuolar-type H+-ATPase subunit H